MNLTKFIRRYPPLRRGIYLAEPKTNVGQMDVQLLPVPDSPSPQVRRIPLSQFTEKPAQPVVAEGDHVQRKQVIAVNEESGESLHSPFSGKVTGIVKVTTPFLRQAKAIELTVDVPDLSKQDYTWPGPPTVIPKTYSELRQLMFTAGVNGNIPEEKANKPISTVIINGLDSTPFEHANIITIHDADERVVETASMLHELLGARRTYLAIDGGRHELVKHIEQTAHGKPVRVTPLINKHPQYLAHMLIKTICKREVPLGKNAEDIGVAVMELPTLLDIARCVSANPIITHRLLNITGKSVARCGHYWVPQGTSIRTIADAVGIRGMLHKAIPESLLNFPSASGWDMVITKRSKAVFFLPTGPAELHTPSACIRCGACQDTCPVALSPRALLDAFERRDFSNIGRLHPSACLECGLCDYVCPSELPLMRSVIECRSKPLD